MTYLFWALAALALTGLYGNMKRRNGHAMAYSAAMVVIWALAALWWSGALG